MKIKLNELLIFFFTFLFASACYCQQWQKNIAPGIDYVHLKISGSSGIVHVHILKLDLNNSKINIKPELARGVIGNLEKTSDIAISNNAIAAVNGSFFEVRKKLHLPIGTMIIDGQVVNKSMLERAAIGITKGKEIIFGIPKTKGYAANLENRKSVPIWGVNRPRKKNEVVIYTNEYGESTRTNKFGKELIVGESGIVTGISSGNSNIPKDGFVVSLHGWSRDFIAKTKVGDRIGLYYDLTDKWKEVDQAITGGPLLIKEGEIVHEKSIIDERFKSEMLPPNSRTAIGLTKEKELLLVVADKRFPVSAGVTYDEMARIMKEAGAVDAMGLDGGHASTMYINGDVVNYPLTGTEGLVSNAIIVTYDGWKLASPPKVRYRYVYVYRPPSEGLIEALKNESGLTPTAYIPRPEDFGMWGLYDIYNRVIRPLVPDATGQQLSSRP